MKRLSTALVGSILFIGASAFLFAAKPDPRLATVRKAWIEAIDELADDRLVVACLPERLKASTPIIVVEHKEDADVVLKVKAHIPGKGARYALGGAGKTPSSHVDALLPDGTLLWSDGAKSGKFTSGGVIGASRSNTGIACGLAEGIAQKLVDAMRDARGKK